MYKKIILAIITILAAVLCLTACSENYSFKAVDMPTSLDVTSNGGLAVKVGEYVYFVNGTAEYTADNTYGSVNFGAIVRIKIDDIVPLEDGEEHKYENGEMVVPKLNFFASEKSTGLYVEGDRLYFTTPNNTKNTSGDIQYDKLDIMSVKLDGSDVVKYLTVDSYKYETHFSTVDGKVYLYYLNEGTIYSADLSASKPSLTTCVEDVTAMSVVEANGTVYFTKSIVTENVLGEEETAAYNQLYVADASTLSSATMLLEGKKGNTAPDGIATYKEDVKFTVVLQNENRMYYTISGSNLSYAGTYVYDVTAKTHTKITEASNSAIVEYKNGILLYADTYVKYYEIGRKMSDAPVRLAYLSSATLKYVKGDYLYYTASSLLYRIDLSTLEDTGIIASKSESINTSTMTETAYDYDLVLYNDCYYMFFINSTYKMVYCMIMPEGEPIDTDEIQEIFVGIDIEEEN
ncbi:MAG: hypothetical protein PHX51_00295 [Clostridia bacterium]|nr:hypothetical protein [Clostridia bacterium]